MRLGRIASPDGVAFVSIEGDGDAAVVREIDEHPFGTPTFTGRSWPLADVRLLAPILASKVVCMGKNYAEHIAEMGGEAPEDPVIFLKPNTAIIGPNVPIQLPANASPVHHEGELAAVIGRPCKDVPAARAFDPATIGPDDLGLRFPLLVKPVTRLDAWNERFGLRKALAAENLAALQNLWPQLRDLGLALLAQELVPGAEARIDRHEHAPVGDFHEVGDGRR